MFCVHLDNKNLIISYILGKIRRCFIWIVSGNRVKVEVYRYDSTREHIIYRLRNKDSKD